MLLLFPGGSSGETTEGAGKKIGFTNGVFDILHQGHIFSLSQAAREADYLVVGLNSDASVRRLKGEDRPVNVQDSRALGTRFVIDSWRRCNIWRRHSLQLIKTVMPDVLVKGGDYTAGPGSGAVQT